MVSHTMLAITSLTVFLCLFPCTHQLKLTSNPLQRGSSGSMLLNCQGESRDATDVGVFWFRQKKGATYPESILFLSSINKPIYRDPSDSNRFKASMSGNLFTLVIERFDEKDQGTYYCLINKNAVLTFSPGLQLIYPEVTTQKPRTTKATARTTESGDSCNCITDKQPELLGLPCDLYVWAPLAGICGVFLICLLITSIMLCCRTRRRRCRCKPKPMDEKNGKMNIPNRHM
ncbi:T-cell surface glycoprotein CD8 alpha chain [Bufo gargarizans]|uniref:T-cell surface glycoprotein CD8 alpha chain n=1 Tax=Bufo gargarizans TaxID=30331 RepID=UPI001CF42FF3|nr:T-cell surface glycoprotein CD8 alpha chain [Bufo gargarizans]